jgi:hypothetical protein
MSRSQITISAEPRLLACLRFAAMKDGLAPSTKGRQILHQALRRTMESDEFIKHIKYVPESEEAAEARAS